MQSINDKKYYKIPGYFLTAILNMVTDVNSNNTNIALVVLGQMYNELQIKEFEEID